MLGSDGGLKDQLVYVAQCVIWHHYIVHHDLLLQVTDDAAKPTTFPFNHIYLIPAVEKELTDPKIRIHTRMGCGNAVIIPGAVPEGRRWQQKNLVAITASTMA